MQVRDVDKPENLMFRDPIERRHDNLNAKDAHRSQKAPDTAAMHPTIRRLAGHHNQCRLTSFSQYALWLMRCYPAISMDPALVKYNSTSRI